MSAINRYTHGEINLFLEAEQRFDFNPLIEWVLRGKNVSNFASTSPTMAINFPA